MNAETCSLRHLEKHYIFGKIFADWNENKIEVGPNIQLINDILDSFRK